jgi:hypothetical protein
MARGKEVVADLGWFDDGFIDTREHGEDWWQAGGAKCLLLSIRSSQGLQHRNGPFLPSFVCR